MINHVFISISAVQIYGLSYIHLHIKRLSKKLIKRPFTIQGEPNYCYNKHISYNSHHKRSQNIPTSLSLWHYYTVQFVLIHDEFTNEDNHWTSSKMAECIVVGFEKNPAISQSKNQRERKQVWQVWSSRIYILIFLKIENLKEIF